MLPRKDLVRAKQYFIIDAACAATAYALHQVEMNIQDEDEVTDIYPGS